MRLPDNYFRELNAADIIAAVAASKPSLAVISTLGADELERIGWLNNPVIDILYSMTSAGVWIARTDASGRETEANSASISSNVATSAGYSRMTFPLVSSQTSLTSSFARRIAQIPLTEAGGAIGATVIVTGISGYFACARIKKIWAPTGTTDAANTWTIASEGGGAITGPTVFVMNITAERNHWCDAGEAGVSGDGILVYNTTDDKDITITVADLAAVGTTYYLEVEYWYET